MLSRGLRLMGLRGELVERSFAHMYDTGGVRRTHLRGRDNILKRLLIHPVAVNLALLVRKQCGICVNIGFIIAGLSILSMAVAQKPSNSPRWIVLVEPSPGAPLSAEQAEERILTSADGTRRAEVITTKVFRDSAGRTRVDSASVSEDAQSTAFVTIADPVARSVVTLLPATQMASRITAPQSARGFGFAFPPIDGELRAGGLHTKTDDLGIRMIEGIEFRGTRTELTGQKPGSVVTFTERWFSAPLQLTGSITVASPSGNYSVALKHIQRVEPDPALFVVPVGYAVQDATWPPPR